MAGVSALGGGAACGLQAPLRTFPRPPPLPPRAEAVRAVWWVRGAVPPEGGARRAFD